METASVLQQSRTVHDPLALWYPPDRRLRSREAAESAGGIADGLLSGEPVAPDMSDDTLFIAMHTCAYRAAGRHGRAKVIRSSGRVRWAKRWQAIRDTIVERNLGLVYTMMGRFRTAQADADELLSDAMMSFVRAVELFNPFRGFRFSTYACNVVVRALIRRRKIMNAYRQAFPYNDDGSIARGEPTDRDERKELYLERLQRIMAGNLGELTELERGVLAQRFPASDAAGMTFRDIGHTVGLSKERVRQIQVQALAKLRNALEQDAVLQ